MQNPTWIKPGLTGAGIGAILTVVIGFNYGGWHSNKATERLADDRSATAVVSALVPICVAQFKLDPDGAAKVKEMSTMITGYEQRDYVIKAGWATSPAADAPNRDVASACADALLKARQG